MKLAGGRSHSSFSPKEAESLLARGEVVSVQPWPTGSNAVFALGLAGQKGEIAAIYKPRSGEAPLWDFPSGTLYRRERAAYVVSQALDWKFVPPTVIREGPYGIGAVQLFIEHDVRHDYFSLRARPDLAASFQRIAAFDLLANNADRKGSHCLLDPEGRVWGIDHGITFHEEDKLRTVLWDFAGQPIPKGLLNDAERLYSEISTGDGSMAELRELLSAGEVEALCRRTRHLLEHPVFPPMNPYRRSVPWPLV
ncbi:MAG: SCO1664 family protein [Chloroflexi bacterium]|nr:SCO1664 family protein [Chloroflexota bacterium]